MTLVPGVAVTVVSGKPALMQSVVALEGSATTMPMGRLSVNSRLPTGAALAPLSMVNVSVLVSPREMELGAKLLENPGRVVTTVRLTGDDMGGSPESSL